MQIPIVSGKRLLKALLKNGFIKVRQKGSHVFVKKLDSGRGTVIPVHSNEDLSKGLLKAILSDLDMSIHELMDYL